MLWKMPTAPRRVKGGGGAADAEVPADRKGKDGEAAPVESEGHGVDHKRDGNDPPAMEYVPERGDQVLAPTLR